jgi:hypothetical protein
VTTFFRQAVRFSTAVLMLALFSGVPQLVAQEHVVSSQQIQQELVNSAAQRTSNIEKLNAFFGSDSAQKSLKNAGINPEQVKNAVAQLSDQELSELSRKAGQAQHDFAAGSLTNQQITYILIALATAVIILVIVVA